MDKKAALRRHFRALREQIGLDERARQSHRVARQVLSLSCWKRAKWILLYAPMGDELDVSTLIESGWAQGKHILLPKCVENPRGLSLYLVTSWTDLLPGRWEIQEPDETRCSRVLPHQVDLALIPVVAMDASGCRLGNGGGYYDRLMPYLSATLLVGFDQQLSEESLPRDSHDAIATGWLTPRKNKRCEGEQT